tara:strand:- start:72 stop:551 length:480 start_codon:yes stop_codon:yes gene_type:complete
MQELRCCPTVYHRGANSVVKSVGFLKDVRCVRKEYFATHSRFDTEVAMQTVAAAAGVAPRVIAATETSITMEQVFAANVTADDLVDIHDIYKSLDSLGVIHNSADPTNFMKTEAGRWVLVDFSRAREKMENDDAFFNVNVSFTILCTKIGELGSAFATM